MISNLLHITNGSNLTAFLQDLNFKGHFLTWHEMLCEGPTLKNLDTPEFIALRKDFLEHTFNVVYKESDFINVLNELNKLENYDEIILWFEYDLFCHINLIAVISLLKQKQVKTPIYLVCSGRIKGEEELKGLSQLTPKQLNHHYDTKIKLTVDDIALAQKAWRIYCEHDHNLLKELITRPSNFKYMGACLKAHIKRFSDSRNGLNSLEYNILNLVKAHDIKSKHHLLGYALHYQGYYGFGDLQLEKIINRLTPFLNITKKSITLNEKGLQALNNDYNFSKEIDTNITYGGVNRNDFQFSKIENKLIALN